MERTLKVTYYLHSGFSCALDRVLLIFDYWLGENRELAENKRIDPADFANYDEIYVFISHAHPDHFDPEVMNWHRLFPVTYVVSHDMPIGVRGKRMAPGDAVSFGHRVKVKAFDSTDLGVSFLVDLDGIRIFHAGDLNFWHWREESTVAEIEEAEEEFNRALVPLSGEPIDIAFFPVDPRQGRMFDAGANTFIMSVKPRLLIPMHFWGRAETAVEFARRARCRDTEVVAMVRPASTLTILIDEDGFMTIRVSGGPPSADGKAGLPGDDVFSESDLPVEL